MPANPLTALLASAVSKADTVPAGLVDHVVGTAGELQTRVAAAICGRPDLPLPLRERLTERAAGDAACPDPGGVLALLVNAQVLDGADPMGALHAAWATPAAREHPAQVLVELVGLPAGDQVLAAVLDSGDLVAWTHLANAALAPKALAERLIARWDHNTDPENRKAVVKVAVRALPGIAYAVRGDGAFWDTIDSDELVLHWAARCESADSRVQQLRAAAATRVLPAWFAGDLPGRCCLHAVNSLTRTSVKVWKTPFLTQMAELAAQVDATGSTRSEIVRHITSTLARRTAAEQRRGGADKTKSRLNHVQWYEEEVGQWFLACVPDTANAWAVVTEIAANPDRGEDTTLSDLVSIANTVLA